MLVFPKLILDGLTETVFRTVQSQVFVDGGQHAEQVEADSQRTAFLQRLGYRVIRFWNTEVLQNTDAVIERIAEELNGHGGSDGDEG